MTTIELQAKKAELVKKILDMDDELVIMQLSNMVDSLARYPCMHPIDEIQNGVKDAIRSYKEGNGIPHDEMKKRHSA